MRDLQEVPHSTERCKITTNSVIWQIFFRFSVYLYEIYRPLTINALCSTLIIALAATVSYTPQNCLAGVLPPSTACRISALLLLHRSDNNRLK